MRNEIIKVLIIEDDEGIRADICRYLLQQNFYVLRAENGKVGYKLALEYLPDIIISDIVMPEMDGFEVLEKLKKNPVTAGIPFIFLSTISSKASQRLSKELGANHYLIKPFLPNVIFPVINNLLNR